MSGCQNWKQCCPCSECKKSHIGNNIYICQCHTVGNMWDESEY
jgi:hypothetical protein